MNRFSLSSIWLLTRPSIFLSNIPGMIKWKIAGPQPDVFLTFDDGPNPQVTPWVLDTLKEAEAKATFFCLGKHVEENPELYQRIIDEGHSVGNHSYSHIKGFRNTPESYFKDIDRAATLIKSNLFRPPFGHLTAKQAQILTQEYEIIMWDIMSWDFDSSWPGPKVYNKVRRNVKKGSIILFHDSEKAENNLRFALPRTLDFLNKSGYQLKSIPQSV